MLLQSSRVPADKIVKPILKTYAKQGSTFFGYYPV
jgi:hypothetical protein